MGEDVLDNSMSMASTPFSSPSPSSLSSWTLGVWVFAWMFETASPRTLKFSAGLTVLAETNLQSWLPDTLCRYLKLGSWPSLDTAFLPFSSSDSAWLYQQVLCGFQLQLPAELVLWLSGWNPVPRALALTLHCQTLSWPCLSLRLWPLLLCL